MKFADRVKETTSSASASVITLAGAVAGYRTFAGSLSINDVEIPVCVTDASGNWEIGLYTLTDAHTLTRTSIVSSSAGGTSEAMFAAGAKDVFCTVPSNYLAGASVSEYLASNPGSPPSFSDLILFVQGQSVVGEPLSAVTLAVNKAWINVADVIVPVTSTNRVTLDVTQHNRRRIVCSAAATIAAPSAYESVGDGFSCKVSNLAGADVALAGITVLPSGASTIPAGRTVEIFAVGGLLYADLGSATTASGVGAVLPGQVTGLTAGTATDITQPLTWTAPATGTAPFTYKVEKSPAGAGSWAVVATGVSATSYTVSGLTANTPYDYRVTAVNSVGNGTPSSVVSNTTSAASGGGTSAAPFTVTNRAGFPIDRSTYTANGDGNSFWTDITPTGAATASAVTYYMSESSTTPPTDGVHTTSPKGDYAVAQMWNPAGSATLWETGVYIHFNITGAAIPMYFWVKVVDSNSATWWFRRTTTTNYLDGIAPTVTSAVESMVQM